MKKNFASIVLVGLIFNMASTMVLAEQVTNQETAVIYDLENGTSYETPIIFEDSPDEFLAIDGNSDISTLEILDNPPVDEAKVLATPSPRTIFHPTWTKVTSTANPYNKICYLYINFPSGVQTGTGFMIRPGKVLTAAHCLVNTKGTIGEKPASILMSFARNNNSWVTQTTAYASSFTVNSAFNAANYSVSNDYGVISVNKSVSDITGAFGFNKGVLVNSNSYTVTGYPYDNQTYFGKNLYKDSGVIESVGSNGIIKHKINGTGGVSGAPMYDSKNVVVGMYVAEDAGHSLPNSAVKFSDNVFALVNSAP